MCIFVCMSVIHLFVYVLASATGTIYTIQDLQNECRLHVACLVYVQDLYHADPIGPLAVSVTFNGTRIVNI